MADGRIELAHEAEFVLGELVVSPATCAVMRGRDGATQALEPRVMQVLVALARAQGGTLSRDDLIRCCWDSRIVSEDAINRVIGHLRRLSKRIGENTFRIETITKVGYRLVSPAPTDRAADVATAEPLVVEVAPVSSAPPERRMIRPLVLLASIALVGAAGAALYRNHVADRSPVSRASTVAYDHGIQPQAAEPLPTDPRTAALYLHARQTWAQRNSGSIGKAIGEFGAVIGRDPSYAPAYAGLADAYILAREYGTQDDGVAFPKARAAALVALKLQPDLPSARRAMGFVQYWWEHDPVTAGKSFRRALALDPDDAQTHFWYGNVLADNGDFKSAIRELDAARAINPESIAIQADWAWALWSAGDRDRAVRTLVGLEKSHPDFATPHDCLRTIYLSERNYPRYLDESLILAKLRAAPEFRERATAERDALLRGGPALLQQLLLRHALEEREKPVQDLAWAAFVASSIGDRDALLALLRKADERGEKWGSAGQTANIARRWSGDARVFALLTRRKAPPIE